MVFNRWKERKRIAEERASAQRALLIWEMEVAMVDDVLHAANHLDELRTASEAEDVSIRLDPDEVVVMSLEDEAGLIELRTDGGTFTGRSQSLSVPVIGGLRFQAGRSEGSYEVDSESLTVVDRFGDLYITTQRTVYVSERRSREWSHDALISTYDEDDVSLDRGATILASNSNETAGVTYPMIAAAYVRDRFELALSIHSGTVDEFVTDLEDRRADLIASRPPDPTV